VTLITAFKSAEADILGEWHQAAKKEGGHGYISTGRSDQKHFEALAAKLLDNVRGS